ncbi:MAG: Xaa-Pro peptidase family protein [Acidobacteria bacterium]|nr:Xaa-Pro peptidase family protein [Acidobacteriota bacterium]
MPNLTADLLQARHERVRRTFDTDRLDALVVTHLPNVRYLTGFDGSAAIAVLTRDELVFITDGRYVTAVRESVAPTCPAFRLVPVDPTYDATLVGVIDQTRLLRVGFESGYLSVRRHQWIVAALEDLASHGSARVELVPSDRRVESERLRKDPAELAAFRQAGELLDRVAADVLASIRVGQVERDIAAEIDFRLKKGGFEGPAFDTIVASGPNSALPHARPGPRALTPGDLVVLDFGGVYDGYCVDLTRTVCVGEPSAEAQRLYDAVFEAQTAALAVIRPGVRVSEVDQAARGVLERHGLGPAFGHATGHGLGLEVHEEPRVGPLRTDVPGVAPVSRDEVLEPGLVITVEPGAYVAGLGGVRIEDDVAVVAGGAELLTHVSRKLLVV